MNNEPVACECSNVVHECSEKQGCRMLAQLNTHPAKPSICVGYWDNKTGAFHKNLTELQQKRVTDGFLQAVYTKSMFPADLTNEEIIDVVESVFGTFYSMMACNNSWVDFARAILRKASEK